MVVLSGLCRLPYKVAFNKLLRKLWCLQEHLILVLCTVLLTISAFIINCSNSFLSSSSSSLVRSIFSASSQYVYSFVGCNNIYGFKHLITCLFSDLHISYIVHRIR